MGRPVVDSLRIMIDCHSLPDALEDLLCECSEVLQKLIATSLAPMPGVVELVSKLHGAHVPIAVATSGTREYADHVLSRLNLKERFQFILTAEDIHRGKPDPGDLSAGRTAIRCCAAEMMVLEDSANGCRAGVAAGAFTIAVPNRHTRNHNFTGARFVAETLADPRIPQALHLA